MTDVDFIKIFIDFLKEHKVLDKYVNNVSAKYPTSHKIFNIIFNQDPKEYISCSFLWVSTSRRVSLLA